MLPNSISQKRRGYLLISEELLESHNEFMFAILRKFIPFRVGRHLPSFDLNSYTPADSYEFVGVSNEFEEVDNNRSTPLYKANVKSISHETGGTEGLAWMEYVVEFERVPDPELTPIQKSRIKHDIIAWKKAFPHIYK